jgi:pyruvate dehydrogenase E2 component (dihydrolipoamide acetyltransferase)
MASEIKLQALKENVDSVEVNAVKVAPGDVVAKDQPLLEVQADKAALDVPSPVAGRVAKVLVKPGDEIKVGQPYCLIETNGAEEKAAAEGKIPALTDAEADERAIEEEEEPSRRERRSIAREVTPIPAAARGTDGASVAPRPPRHPVIDHPLPAPAPAKEKLVLAGPATRRLARELGVDLSQVPGTGRHGRVVAEDVKAFVRQLAAGVVTAPITTGPGAPPPLPRFEEWGAVERQPLNAVRKATARQMSLAWSQIPHVTQHDLADVTDLEAFRKSQEGKGPKLTVTAFALKAVGHLLREFPIFNASLDLASNQLVLKRYCHVGVAVDTDNGLLVPVIRDVDRKGVRELAEELAAIAERARQRKLDAAELKGGTFTITNLGGIGGTGFTPIVNWPEVAILGMSRSRLEPVVRNGQVVPRLLLPLSLSYDHRVIDGAAAARFTRRCAEMLENPLLMLL